MEATFLQVLQQDLVELERKYRISSEEFYEKFQAGQIGDEADFMEWNVLYKMTTKLRNRLGILQGQKSGWILMKKELPLSRRGNSLVDCEVERRRNYEHHLY